MQALSGGAAVRPFAALRRGPAAALAYRSTGAAQLALTLLAAFLFFRKNNHYLLWLAVPVVVTAARCAAVPRYRREVRARLWRLWNSLDDFARCGGACPWRAAGLFVVGPAFLFLLSNDRTLTNGDTWPVVPTADRLVAAGRWDLDAALPCAPEVYGRPLPYCATRAGGGTYSSYPAGMVTFAAPVAAVARCCGARTDRPAVQQRIEKWTAAAVTAAALGLFFLLALHLAPPAPALLTTGLLAAGSALTSSCGQALWQQGGVVFWMLAVLLAEFRQAARPSAAGPLLQGISCAMMLACRLSAALFVVAFGVWLLARAPRRAVATAAVAAAAYLPWAALYFSIYGNVFGPSTAQLAGSWWSWGPAAGLAGILFSPGRGLFVYQPWVVLAVPGVYLLARRAGSRQRPENGVLAETGPRLGALTQPRSPAGWWGLCVAVLVLHLALVANWRVWWGGHCWGSRLLAEVVPLAALLALPAVAWLWRCRVGPAALVALGILSFLPHAPVLYGPALEWNRLTDARKDVLWSWAEAPFLYPLGR